MSALRATVGVAVGAPSFTTSVASFSISANIELTAAASKLPSRTNRLRTTSKAIGARRKPTAEPTPALAGISTSAMPSFSASRAACSGAPPPKAISVRPSSSAPRSTACTRAALAMFSSTISEMPKAASVVSSSTLSPTWASMAVRLRPRVERDRAAGEAVGIDAAQHHVGVRHGRPRAAQPIARRAGVGAGALGPDRDALHGVDAGQRAAARADLDHLDHRDAHRQAGALHEAVAAVDLEAARGHRLAVVDDADLGRRAAHVEAQDAVDAEALGDPGRQDHAAGRPDSTSRMGKRTAVSSVVRPPPEVISRTGQAKPAAAMRARRLSR